MYVKFPCNGISGLVVDEEEVEDAREEIFVADAQFLVVADGQVDENGTEFLHMTFQLQQTLILLGFTYCFIRQLVQILQDLHTNYLSQPSQLPLKLSLMQLRRLILILLLFIIVSYFCLATACS